MSTYSLKTRNLVSTWLNLGFLLLLTSFVFFIEFFLDSNAQKSAINMLDNPIGADYITNVTSLDFKNRLGEFTMTKDEDKGWILLKPRVIPASKKTIQLILNALAQLNIKTIHQYEPINLQSFSLYNPIYEIGLTNKLGEKLKVTIGLNNPIDETSYLTVTGQSKIYQTNLIKGKLESLELIDFIDSNIFSFPLKDLKSIQIFSGKQRSSKDLYSFNGVNWETKKYNHFDEEKLEAEIVKLLNTKPHQIIDSQTEELENFLDNYIKNPRYTITAKLKDGKKRTYTISYVIKNTKELKLEKNQYVIITASDRSYPYIVNKKILKEIPISYNKIKK